MRTFVAAVDAGQFQEAAADLSVTQQAVSKRIAALERDLGVRLFIRTARGVQLTIDGQAFLPHARRLLHVEQHAAASVRHGGRPLRVDVIGRRLAPAALLRAFHRTHPQIDIDVVTLFNATDAVAAVRAGTVDASFRAVTAPGLQLPDGVEVTPVLDEAHQLLIGPSHDLAAASSVTLAQLVGRRIWIPGAVTGTEWATYYEHLAAAFNLSIDAVGPNFGTEHLLDVIADSSDLATLVGDRTRLVWPADHDLRRIPIRHPTPLYPHCLIWSSDNPHPALTVFRTFLTSTHPAPAEVEGGTWRPHWAHAGKASCGIP